MYNVKDYILIGINKNQILQYFIHNYRRKKYAFLIIRILIKFRQNIEKISEKTINEPMLNTVLNLSVYRMQTNQYIYGLSALHHDTLYIIDIFNEPNWPDEIYMLECIWEIAYL